jgi:hypothetical protein
VDLGGVGEFFFEAGGGFGLVELAEARAGVGESPGGDFYAEVVEGFCYLLLWVHRPSPVAANEKSYSWVVAVLGAAAGFMPIWALADLLEILKTV